MDYTGPTILPNLLNIVRNETEETMALSVYSAGNQIVLKRRKSTNGLFPVTECDEPTLSPLNSVTKFMYNVFNTFAFLLLLHNKGHR